MHPKAQSVTTSLKSGTNKRFDLETQIQFLKGVGPKTALIFENRGIKTVRDILLYLPRDYQDRSTIQNVKDIQAETKVVLKGQITGMRFIPIRKLKRPLLEAFFKDSSGIMSLKWFNYKRDYFEHKFKNQPQVIVFGDVKKYGERKEILHPELEFLDDELAEEEKEAPGILPIYVEPEGLNQRTLRKIIGQGLERAAHLLTDDIPEHILREHKLLKISDAVQKVHNPGTPAQNYIEALRAYKTEEQRRLIFDDFFKFEWLIGKQRFKMRMETAQAFSKNEGLRLFDFLQSTLKFELTSAQKEAVHSIYEDLAQDKPMNRLLQGDVGCGKTLVAFSSILPVLASGSQAVLMAPTEILAQQHLENAKKTLGQIRLFDGSPIQSALLAGSTPKKEREQILEDLHLGKIHFLIGTHAVIEDPVVFRSLGLVIVDEQHRFGVDQRLILRKKGKNPHLLSLTATPIPRTLALTAYGDLDVSTIKELPKGRPNVTTKLVRPHDRLGMYQAIKDQLKKGHQIYIIYPLIEESEKMDLQNAVQGAEELANGPLAGFSMGLLHGRLKGPEKQGVMDRFKAGEIQVLVSTTVIEVGVDVPNATVMVIENAERFGLSQLHQLRGRIGRGTEESFCFLSTQGGGLGEVSFERLKAMEETRDGFRLAELDLKIRGPGQFLGTRQAGALSFPCADIVRDQDVLIEARKAAFQLLTKDPELQAPENVSLKRYMDAKGGLQLARFQTS